TSGGDEGPVDTGGDAPSELCGAGLAATIASWSLEFVPDLGTVLTDCTVDAVDIEPTADTSVPPVVRLHLACASGSTEQTAELVMQSSGYAPPPVVPGDLVRLDYREAGAAEQPFQWFMLRPAADYETLLLLGARGDAPTPAEMTVDEFFGPLQVTIADGNCDSIEADCSESDRQSLSIVHAGDVREVLDQTSTQFGAPGSMFNISLERARVPGNPDDCPESPAASWKMLVTSLAQ
ncbi:MAG: hypothetical protein JKY37_05920, partial [Nannocystaceae bacterium]|nr:hypothetical protein [Nannocystaceae bacterium]